MSGGGGGGGGTPPGDDFPCSSLRFETQIATPQPGVVQIIVVGEILDVRIVPIGGAQAVAVLKNNQIVGGLAGGLVNRLRECLLGGNNFRATVLSISGPQVRVEIEPL